MFSWLLFPVVIIINKLFWFPLAIFLHIFTIQYAIFFPWKCDACFIGTQEQVSILVKFSTSIFLVCAKDPRVSILCLSAIQNLQNSTCLSRQLTAFSPLKS